ncbi:1332_t:CDS:2 [Acaulospora colombiana]|uniref:1332_t:CDS:1 n=1 Tax=Acaulospora colombiana TaxID=27376 RepID=A0ACA9KH99_9GLOM|nr:1332_t:CDS:2 [Acaulospora colombiana]
MAHSTNYVPILSLSSISEIYPPLDVNAQSDRCRALIETFRSVYPNRSPKFISRAPGRVNLIGEHIDYAGFGVLPMALSRDILIAVDVSDDDEDRRVRIANVNGEKYKPSSWEFEGKEKIVEIIVEEGVSVWCNYFRCGYKGILQYLGIDNPKGMYCLVDGTVPSGAGLSSSSAFVCSVALATSLANNANLTKKQITEISIESERLCGMNTGGMDQTASIFSQKGHALYIQFLPSLNATPVRLPSIDPPIAFVIANSLVTADKVVTAPIHYNLRVIETKLAAYDLGKTLFGKECENLKQVCDLHSETSEVKVSHLEFLSEFVENHYSEPNKREGHSLDELAELLNLSKSEIHAKFLSKFPVRAERFHLYKRSKHVFDEALRVLRFHEICLASEKSNVGDREVKENDVGGQETFENLGRLMNQSHESCKKLFDCSCDELDKLVRICLDGGAVGSRLTGAGWGGCTVSLIREDQIEPFIQHVIANYYKPLFPHLTKKQLNDAIFATRPGSGAAIIVGLEGAVVQ